MHNPPELNTSEKKLLIIEDNVLCQQLYIATFKGTGYQYDLVGAAYEAIRQVNQNTYDCILTDLGLPDASELTLLTAIRLSSLNSNTPLFVISAHVSDKMREECFRLGALGVYIKPVLPPVLRELAGYKAVSFISA